MNNKYCKLQGSNKIYLIEKYIDDIVVISCGKIHITTNISNVSILPEDFVPQKPNTRSNISISSTDVPNEIMLRHKFKDEAISELDKYIDQAIVAKLGRVRIIHGKHGGILRNAVHEYLKTHPYIKDFHIADYHEGGIGVTIAIIGKKP